MFLFLSGVRALLLRVGATTPAYLAKKSKENLNSGVEKPRNLGQPDGGKNRDLLKNSSQIVCVVPRLKGKRENHFQRGEKIRKLSKTRCIFCNAKWPHKITWHKKQDIFLLVIKFFFSLPFFSTSKSHLFVTIEFAVERREFEHETKLLMNFSTLYSVPVWVCQKAFFLSPYIRL